MSRRSGLLSRALWLDAVVSGVAGVGLLAVPGTIAAFLGLASRGLVAGVGVALLLWAAGLARNARRETPSRTEAAWTVALNLAWVAGSAVVIAGGWLSTSGNWAVALVADAVLAFAILEAIGLRRMTAARLGAEPA
jgi:hypothetical protein